MVTPAFLLAQPSAVSIAFNGRCSPFWTKGNTNLAHAQAVSTSNLRRSSPGPSDSLPISHNIQSPRSQSAHSSCEVLYFKAALMASPQAFNFLIFPIYSFMSIFHSSLSTCKTTTVFDINIYECRTASTQSRCA